MIELDRIENYTQNDDLHDKFGIKDEEATNVFLNDSENVFQYDQTKKLNLSWQNLNVQLTSQVVNKKQLTQIFKRQNSNSTVSDSSYRTIINNGK